MELYAKMKRTIYDVAWWKIVFVCEVIAHTHTHTHRRNGRKYLNFIWPWPNRIHLSRQRTWQWVMAPLFIWKIFVRALWQGPKSSDRHLFYGHSHKGEIYLCGPLSARYAENARLFHFFFFYTFLKKTKQRNLNLI